MTEQQKRIELQLTLDQIVSNLMRQNDISATEMEDALNFVLLKNKDNVMKEFLNAAAEESQKQQEEFMQSNMPQENEVQEDYNDIIENPQFDVEE